MQQQAGLNKRYGLPTVLLAYTMWGILPLYWKMLDAVPSYEIICHRILWSFLFSLALLGLRRKINPFIKNLRDRRTVITFLATASLLGCNWLVYIWSVNNDYIIESSLGYFINPLIAVFFGVVFLREPLRPGQWAALSVALAGVLYLTFSYGRFPWIGLTLAVTFALYSLLRKTAPLRSLDGLTFETGLLTLPAAATLFYLAWHGRSHLFTLAPGYTWLLLGAGPITALPLLCFVFGAQRISMTAVGLMQYLAPTLQFLIGLLLFHEPFPREKLIGFTLVWLALALYVSENVYRRVRQQKRITG
ncbi:MAG TPA: EamA family transporter RarD [Desulfobulbaceae bacterium]|nr:EamA family transporter RarD [Desulfobulbaceae bacterium]